MPLIWAAISGHGYGHAAQVVPVLNALGRRIPDLRVLLRTTVPAAFFRDRLVVPWERSAVQQDVGCIQDGPLSIDVEATWREHVRFHATWADRLQREVTAMRAAAPALVLADTPYLAVAAGKAAAIPTIVLANFTWDLVLSAFASLPGIDAAALTETIRGHYAEADLALRIAPAPKLDICPRIVDVGPIAEPAPPARERLDRALDLAPGEQTVLVGFGGIPLSSLPFATLERLRGYRFLFDGPVPAGLTRVQSIKALPFPFKTVMASVDVIVTKPGYGTIVEAVELRRPVVYVRRYNFADEQPLVDYLQRFGRGVELSRTDFELGRWGPALTDVRTQTHPVDPPAAGGAMEATDLLASYFVNPRG